jgi:hypothetical protein
MVLQELGAKVKSVMKDLGAKVKSAYDTIKSGVSAMPNSAIKQEARDMAWFAHKAYSKSRGEYKGYTYEPSLSNDRRAVWRKGMDFIISQRGTNIDDAQDLTNDLLILIGKEDSIPRATQELGFLNELIAKNPDARINLTSHSLGGMICMLMVKFAIPSVYERIKKVYIFNAGVVNVEQNARWRQKVWNLHIKGDPISITTRRIQYKSNNTYEMKSSASNPHTIDNFL